MLLRYSFLLIILLSLGQNAHCQKIKWHEFRSFEGKFKVKIPARDMKEKVDTFKTSIGKMAYHTFIYQDQDTSDVPLYMISYCDYPEYSIHSDSTDLLKEFFKATVEEATFNIQGSLKYSSDLQVQGFPAHQWRIDYNKGTAVIRTKAIVVGNRYYTIQAMCKKEKSFNRSIDMFLDSFYLTH